MATTGGPNIVTDGLVLALDAANPNSYPGSGTTWYDVSGKGGNGVLTNGPELLTPDTKVIEFSGTNEFIRFERSDINAGSFIYDLCTIYIWVKPVTTGYNTSGQGANLFTIENTVEVSIGDRTNGYSKLYYASNPWAWRGTNSDALVNGIWNLVTYVHKFDSRELLVNGKSVYTSAESGNLGAGSSGYPYLTLMGRYSGTSSPCPGQLGSVSMYSVAHTQSEILQIYNATKSRFNL